MYPYDDTETDSGAHEQQHKLQRLVEDPLYWREQDPEFRSYVDNGFKAVYGDNAAEADATGRTIDPAPKPVTLPAFKPRVTGDDMKLEGGVGDNQPNRWRDVWTVQKGLTSTGHYALDFAKEKSGERSPTLDSAIRNFQREKREQIDGTLLPGGPTIKRLKQSMMVENGSRPAALRETTLLSGNDDASGAERGSFELASYGSKQKLPRRPGDDSTDPIRRVIQWTLEQIRRIPEKPSTRSPKRTPEESGEIPPDKRSVIFTMPNEDAYILLNPIPRGERRPHEKSDFVQRSPAPDDKEPRKAQHFVYKKDSDARTGFGWALPMYPEEAEGVRQRAADRQDVSPHNPRMLDKLMYPANPRREDGDRRRMVYINYYHRDGDRSRVLARNPKTGKPLYAPGDDDVFIAAPDAIRLGLIDWMRTKPPRGNFPEIFERDSWNRFGPVPPGEQGLWR